MGRGGSLAHDFTPTMVNVTSTVSCTGLKKALYCAKVSAIERDAPLHDDLVLPLFYSHRNSYAFGYTAHLQIALHHIFQAISGESRGRKSNRRVLVNKQKILRTQVLIALSVGGIEGQPQ